MYVKLSVVYIRLLLISFIIIIKNIVEKSCLKTIHLWGMISICSNRIQEKSYCSFGWLWHPYHGNGRITTAWTRIPGTWYVLMNCPLHLACTAMPNHPRITFTRSVQLPWRIALVLEPSSILDFAPLSHLSSTTTAA